MATSWPFCKQEPKMFMVRRKCLSDLWSCSDVTPWVCQRYSDSLSWQFVDYTPGKDKPLFQDLINSKKASSLLVLWDEGVWKSKETASFHSEDIPPSSCTWHLPFAGVKQRPEVISVLQPVTNLYSLVSLPSDYIPFFVFSIFSCYFFSIITL